MVFSFFSGRGRGRGRGFDAVVPACTAAWALAALVPSVAHAQGTPRVLGADHYDARGVLAGSAATPASGVPGVASGVTQLAGGDGFSLALAADGTVHAWGPTAAVRRASAVVNAPGMRDAASVAAGRRHALALRRDGTVWFWSVDATAPNGLAAFTREAERVPGIDRVVSICAGDAHSLALRADGTVWAWGENGVGQLGDGGGPATATPVRVHDLTGVRAIACGARHNLAVLSDGSLWAWGDNATGQLGFAGAPLAVLPRRVEALPTITSVAAGAGHSLAIAVDGSVWAWGANGAGQLGDRTRVGRAQPARVPGIDDARSVAAGAEHSLARRGDGSVWAWGGNLVGQLGDEAAGAGRCSPGPVRGVASASQVAAGRYHTLVLEGRAEALANVSVSQTVRPLGAHEAGSRGARHGRRAVLYEVTVVNHGPDAAAQVRLDDVLPADATLLSVRADRGSCDADSTGNTPRARCDLGQLPDGAAAVIEIRATVVAEAVRDNTATASTTTEDPDALDDRSDLAHVVTPGAPDVADAVRDFERP